MAINRIPKEKKDAYNIVVRDYKERVEETVKRAKTLERDGMLGKDINAKYTRIAAASVYLKTIGLYCEMNDKSVEIMNIKSELYLTNARKNIYQAIKLLESIVGVHIDSPLGENSDTLEELKIMNPHRILNMLKKLEYCIALVEFEEGENSKWKWNFVELYGKFAGLCKNLVNFKLYAKQMYDPRNEFYEDINEIIRLVKYTIDTAAKKYRTKYELSSRDVSDMNKAIGFMELLIKIHTILNEPEFANEAKKGIEKWKEKLEQDLKKKEEEAQKKLKSSVKGKKKK